MKTIEQRSVDHELDLAVEAAGMDITVKAGSFKYQGADLELVEDAVFTVSTRSGSAWLDGYLVKEVATGDIGVLVDERVSDGVELDLAYEWEGSPYERLLRVFEMAIPSDTSSLSGLELCVCRMIMPPPIADLTLKTVKPEAKEVPS